jgi:hypothetical protein
MGAAMMLVVSQLSLLPENPSLLLGALRPIFTVRKKVQNKCAPAELLIREKLHG